MKAIVIERYGGVDQLVEKTLPDPKPGPNQVVVRVRASTVNPLDYKILAGQLKILTGSNFPRVLGTDVAGEVAELGAGVTRFKVGDRVAGGVNTMSRKPVGAWAEKVVINAEALVPIPDVVTWEEAATLPVAATTALLGLRELARVTPGDAVLINGATGGVGAFAVQTARLLGAKVTAVCSSKNEALAKELGADEVLPYDRGDFRASGRKWKAIFDVAANTSFSSCLGALEKGGTWVSTLPSPASFTVNPVAGLLSGKRAKVTQAMGHMKRLLPELSRWVAEKKLKVPVSDTYPLARIREAVQAAQKSPRGKVAITIG